MLEKFDELGLIPCLTEALAKENITIPTEIQNKVIPKAIENKDLIAQSETGTGKTLAYLLPLFQRLSPEKKEMQAIVLVPTHELAVQVIRQIEQLSENSGIKLSATTIIGNVNIDRQIEKLKSKPNILVGSPGRMLELIKKKKIAAHTIKTIVIDEADRLMDKNNVENVKAVVKSTLRDRQLLMFSATISKDTITKGREMMKEPELIKAVVSNSIPDTIEHLYFTAEKRDKIEVLRKLIRILEPQKAIVFVNQMGEIENVTSKLKYHGINAESLQGANMKLDRKKTLENFRSGKLQVLIASDIAARGLHIEGVTHIINFSMAEDPKDYLHRVGRTGRNGLKGLAVSISTEKEQELIKLYEKAYKITIAEKSMYKGNIVEVRKKREDNKNKTLP